MDQIDMPIYVVAVGQDWIGEVQLSQRIPHAIPCFGDRASAEAFANRVAAKMGKLPSLFRVVEFKASGNVYEV